MLVAEQVCFRQSVSVMLPGTLSFTWNGILGFFWCTVCVHAGLQLVDLFKFWSHWGDGAKMFFFAAPCNDAWGSTFCHCKQKVVPEQYMSPHCDSLIVLLIIKLELCFSVIAQA